MMTTVTQRLPHPPPGYPARPSARPEGGVGASPRAPASKGRIRRNLAGPLLIASEDGTSIAGALRVAEALARRDGVHAHVLGFTRRLAPAASRAVARATGEVDGLEEYRRQREHARVRRKVHHTVGLSTLFSSSAKLGGPDSAAAAAARARGAEYILVGLPSAGSRARAATLAGAARLAAAADVPVLAVPPDAQWLPRRAVVRMDFGEASMRAVSASLALLDDGASLTLASVVPGEAGALRRFSATLGALARLDVQTAALPGGADELPALVGDFDLVAAGMSAGEPAEADHETGDSALFPAARGCILVVPAPADVGEDAA